MITYGLFVHVLVTDNLLQTLHIPVNAILVNVNYLFLLIYCPI